MPVRFIFFDNYDIKDKDGLIKRAQEELKELGTHTDFLKIEDQAKIKSHIAERTEKCEQLNQLYASKGKELKQQFEDENNENSLK